MTHEDVSLATNGTDFTVRGFHGDYEIQVKYKGQRIPQFTKKFTLGKEDINVVLDLNKN